MEAGLGMPFLRSIILASHLTPEGDQLSSGFPYACYQALPEALSPFGTEQWGLQGYRVQYLIVMGSNPLQGYRVVSWAMSQGSNPLQGYKGGLLGHCLIAMGSSPLQGYRVVSWATVS